MATPLRWGILGTARINKRLAPAMRAAGDEIAIVGSRDRARADEAAREYGARGAGSYEDVLAADVDAVYVSLPNALHRPWTLRAADAGKHVLCEKPLATSVAACEDMVAACRARGVHLVEAFMYRYHPQWDLVWDVVRSGRYGRITTLRAGFGFPLTDPANVRLVPELGAGALQDVGCYVVNVARWFLGEPTAVRGVSRDRGGDGVDTHCTASLAFPSGAQALLECSFETFRTHRVEINFERGRVDVASPFVARERAEVRFVDPDGERVEVRPPIDQYRLEIEAFRALIRDGIPSRTPGDDAARTQAVLAAWRSGAS